MKILIYSHAFAPLLGGVETIVMALARGLCESGGEDTAGADEVTVVTATAPGGFDDGALPFRVIRQPGLAELLSLLRAADVVHLAGPAMLPLVAAILLRKRVVLEHHGFQTICPNGQLVYNPDQMPCPGHFMAGRYQCCLRCNAGEGPAASLKLLLLTFPRRWLARRVAANVAPTRWLEGLLGLPRTTTIVHGLRAGAPAAAPASSSIPVITFAGRLVGSKGVAVLLEAAALLRDKGLAFRLDVIGDGPARGRLEHTASRLLLSDFVRFLGALPSADLEARLAESTAIVMPSLGGEVFGLVALEAMLRGRLVVASDIGALAEVVGDGGISFAVGDARALASALERVLTSPAAVAPIRQRARARGLALFGHDLMIERHRALYHQVARPARAAGS